MQQIKSLIKETEKEKGKKEQQSGKKRANPVSCLVSNSSTGSKVVKQGSPPKKNPKVQSKLNNLVQKMPTFVCIFIFVIRYLVNTLNIAAQNGMTVDDFVEILKKVRRIVGFFHRSSTGAALLKSTQIGLMIPKNI